MSDCNKRKYFYGEDFPQAQCRVLFYFISYNKEWTVCEKTTENQSKTPENQSKTTENQSKTPEKIKC